LSAQYVGELKRRLTNSATSASWEEKDIPALQGQARIGLSDHWQPCVGWLIVSSEILTKLSITSMSNR
jgi:hypothetical protein